MAIVEMASSALQFLALSLVVVMLASYGSAKPDLYTADGNAIAPNELWKILASELQEANQDEHEDGTTGDPPTGKKRSLYLFMHVL